MTIELTGAIVYFAITVLALLFSITKVSQIDKESFPNRARFFAGLALWILAAVMAVFVSFPGYPEWFVPAVYPILKIAFILVFLVGFFMVLTTLIAFPVHMEYHRREIDGRSDRIALLENIRQIASQPYPVTELFTLVLKELGSFLSIGKGAIFLSNPSRREMYLVSSIGLNKDELGRLERFPVGRDMISQAAADQEVYVSGDLSTADSASRKLILAGREITLSAAAVPLSVRDRALGTLLVLSNKPYRFEKRDRMLLQAAAEAVAGVIEANRLTRENRKIDRRLDMTAGQLRFLRDSVTRLAASDDIEKSLSATCRYLVENYQASSASVISIAEGEFVELGKHEKKPTGRQSESFRIAVVNSIRDRKMIVLNQEARDSAGNTYISRSVLVCPLSARQPREAALLIEAPGNSLPLSKEFLSDLDGIVSLIVVVLNSIASADTGRIGRSALTSLLSILKIRHNDSPENVYRRFLEELRGIAGAESSMLAVVRDDSGYRILTGYPEPSEDVVRVVFQPGEGPIGKAMASGEIDELTGPSRIEKAWSDLEAVNQDFLNRLFEEKGIPEYELIVPIRILDDVGAAITIFSHDSDPGQMRQLKGLFLLTSHLLSIKLSMAELAGAPKSPRLPADSAETGRILNRLNNDLAAIVGRAQLLQQHSDTTGRAKYTADEIIKAAEQAAEVVRGLQSDIAVPANIIEDSKTGLDEHIDGFLQRRHVTGNLYMFDDNRAIMLQNELVRPCPFSPSNENIIPLIETVLRYFVALVDEGDEVLLRSEVRDDLFYVSLVRGSRDTHRRFDPTIRDFGDPDVLPSEIVPEDLLRSLAENRGEVSFDRFGRRPTYLSFRFPCAKSEAGAAEDATASPIAGLKILAIDDQQMILDLLAGICQSLGIELIAVRNPSEGLRLFQDRQFDMVMVDLAIGAISGWDVAREIKKRSPATPVIMLTGWGADVAGEKAAEGIVDYTLSKPFRIEQLTEIISRAGSRQISS